MAQLTFLDYSVVFIYSLLLLGMGFYFLKRQRTTDDYFIASKRIPGWAMGFALLSTLVSNITFIALPASAFAGNWDQFIMTLPVPLVLIPIALYIIPYYRKHIKISIYEFLEKRFNYTVRLYGAITFILLYLFKMGFVFYLLALAINVMTGWNIYILIFGLGTLTIFYTLLGGIEAVTWSDVIQGILLITGGIISLVVALYTLDGGAEAVFTIATENDKFNFGSWNFNFTETTIWVMFLYGIYHFFHTFATDQTMAQRYLTAKTTKQAISGAFIGGVACVPVWGLFFLIGTSLWGFYELSSTELPKFVAEKADRIYPFFILSQLPSGVTGLILAALLASAMSSLDSGLNSIATVYSRDILSHFRKDITDKRHLKIAHYVVATAGLVALLIAVTLTFTKENALVMLFIVQSILAGGILGLFMLGFLTKRANAKGAIIGITIMIVVTLWATISSKGVFDFGELNFPFHVLMIGLLGHIIVFVIGYLASLFTQKIIITE